MHSKAVWQQTADWLKFEGCWNHFSVSQHWSELSVKKCPSVDVTQVDVLDSSFLTLLLQVSPHDQPLRIQGASLSLLALIELYNLNSVFQIHREAKP